MGSGTCESFQPLNTLDFPNALACVDKPDFSKVITSKSPDLTIEPESCLVLANVAHDLPRFS